VSRVERYKMEGVSNKENIHTNGWGQVIKDLKWVIENPEFSNFLVHWGLGPPDALTSFLFLVGACTLSILS